MKIRTDFVTNSSSSSFILTKKVDCREFMHREFNNIMNEDIARIMAYENWDHINREKTVECLKDDIEEYGGMIDGVCHDIKPIREHRVCDILETFWWYRNDIFKRIMKDTADIESIPDSALEKAAGCLMFDFLDKKYREVVYGRNHMWVDEEHTGPGRESFDRKEFRLNETEIGVYFDDYVTDSNTNYSFDPVYQDIVLHYYEKIPKMLMGYKDMDGGVILEKILDAKYMYFDDQETHYAIIGAAERLPECILSCCHMG